MQRRLFGPTEYEVPVIGQGTWYDEGADFDAIIAALRRGLDLGMTHIDTAEMYGAGVVEEVVGRALERRRENVFLVSKVLPQNASYKGTVEACERSLARLRTDWLDCYLLHWRGAYPLEETYAGFEQLQRNGKILAWGVSNFDVPDLEELTEIAGEGVMACNQVLYHLQERAIEHAVLPWCERHGVAVVGYSPFGHGNFPGPGSKGHAMLRQIAEARGATVRQVVLAFLLRRKSLFAIPRASSPEHTAENAGAGDLTLTEDEIERIDAAFPLGPPPRELPML